MPTPTDSAKACKIISHQGGGLYTVEVQYDDTPRTDRIAEIEKKLADPAFQAKLQALEDAYDAKQAERNAWIDLANEKIDAVNNAYANEDDAEIKAAEAALREVTAEGLKARNAMIEARINYHRVLAVKTALEVERLALFREGKGTLPLLSVWCIDLADGLDGRASYANGDYAPLVCLNYDPDTYLLPPKNPLAGGTQPYQITPLGVYNIMTKYRPHDAAGFKYWNCAMEPGFAKWQPILLRGTIIKQQGTCLEDDTSTLVQVSFAFSQLSRFDHELASGTFWLSIKYFDGPASFQAGDQVVCAVTISSQKEKQEVRLGTVNGKPYNKKKIVDVVKITGDVIGYVSNPKIASRTGGNFNYNLALQGVWMLGDIYGGETNQYDAESKAACADLDITCPKLIRTVEGFPGDPLMQPPEGGVRITTFKGYSLTGTKLKIAVAGVPTTLVNMRWSSRRNDIVCRQTFSPLETSGFEVTEAIWDTVEHVIDVEMPNGYWITYTLTTEIPTGKQYTANGVKAMRVTSNGTSVHYTESYREYQFQGGVNTNNGVIANVIGRDISKNQKFSGESGCNSILDTNTQTIFQFSKIYDFSGVIEGIDAQLLGQYFPSQPGIFEFSNSIIIPFLSIPTSSYWN